MKPIARRANLIVQEVANELVIFDKAQNVGHRLSPIAARVWQYCDGKNTVEEIAHLLEQEMDFDAEQTNATDVVWLALDELIQCDLIHQFQKSSTTSSPRSRAMKRGAIAAGFAGAALLPLVTSMLVPAPAMATSPPEQTETPPPPAMEAPAPAPAPEPAPPPPAPEPAPPPPPQTESPPPSVPALY